jgi:hypothetical protein
MEENPQTGREHEVGTLAAPLLTLDLDREIEQLRSEGRWQSGHTAKTLAKYPDLRVVLIVMKAGGRLKNIEPKGESPYRLWTDESGSIQPKDLKSSRLAKCSRWNAVFLMM